MRIVSALPRILLGLVFAVMPWLAILHKGPNPPMPEAALTFVSALMKSGYMMQLVWGIQILSGVLLLLGIFVPFALILLAPILVNIFLFHLFLNSSGLIMAVILCALEVIVAWQYRRAFQPLFTVGAPRAARGAI